MTNVIEEKGWYIEETDDGYILRANKDMETMRIYDVLNFPRKYKITELDLSGCKKLKKIEAISFSDYNYLKRANLSGCESLEEIDSGAFSSCDMLETVDLSGNRSLVEIGSASFLDCERLKHLNLSGCVNLRIIDEGALLGCDSLDRLDVSDCPGVDISQHSIGRNTKVIRERANIPLNKLDSEMRGKNTACVRRSKAVKVKVNKIENKNTMYHD